VVLGARGSVGNVGFIPAPVAAAAAAVAAALLPAAAVAAAGGGVPSALGAWCPQSFPPGAGAGAGASAIPAAASSGVGAGAGGGCATAAAAAAAAAAALAARALCRRLSSDSWWLCCAMSDCAHVRGRGGSRTRGEGNDVRGWY